MEFWKIPPLTGIGKESFVVHLHHIRWTVTTYSGKFSWAGRSAPSPRPAYTVGARSLTLTYNDKSVMRELAPPDATTQGLEQTYVEYGTTPLVLFRDSRREHCGYLRLNARNQRRIRTLLLQLGTLSYHEAIA